MDTNTTSILSAFIGATIGGAASLTGSWLVISHTLKASKEAGRLERRGLLRALYVEMNAIWSGYSTGLKAKVDALKDGDVFSVNLPGGQEMGFPIYSNNASKIGTLHDESLIRSVVNYYTCAQALWEAMAYNTVLLHSVLAAMQRTGSQDWRGTLKAMPVEGPLMEGQAALIRERSEMLASAYADIDAMMSHALGQAADP